MNLLRLRLLRFGIDPTWTATAIAVHVHARLPSLADRRLFDACVNGLTDARVVGDAALRFLEPRR